MKLGNLRGKIHWYKNITVEVVIFIEEYNAYISENKYPFQRDGKRETGREGGKGRRRGRMEMEIEIESE